MLVKELVKSLGSGVEIDVVDALGNVKFSDGHLEVAGQDIAIDEVGLQKVSKYLGINHRYLAKCPQDLQESNINHWLNHWAGANARFFSKSGKLTNIYGTDVSVVTGHRVAEVITRVFEGDDEVKNAHFDGERLELDIIKTNLSVEVPTNHTETRPVGDVTFGGLRVMSYGNAHTPPTLRTYMNRLVCSNGLTIPETDMEIKLKGNNLEEILKELEEKAQIILAGVPDRLAQYAETANVRIPGNVDQFLFQVGRERGLGQRVMDRVMSQATELPGAPTMYDALNIFTDVANQPVTRTTRLRLQGLGGRFVSETEHMLHRCTNCERPL